MKNKKKLLLVSHCILNVRSKIQYAVEFETEEERNRKAFLKKVIEEDIQLIQLPCPEFLMYGGRRWGHSSEQFDNPFFRRQARKMLEDIVLQVKEYQNCSERVEVLGVVGINGSPSCGIEYTFSADWGGELSSQPNLEAYLKKGERKEAMGIFMQVLKEMLEEEGIILRMVPLTERTLEELEDEN